MEQPIDFLALSLLAAVSVTVGLTSASYADGLTGCHSGTNVSLTGLVAGILGLDQQQVDDYLRGHAAT